VLEHHADVTAHVVQVAFVGGHFAAAALHVIEFFTAQPNMVSSVIRMRRIVVLPDPEGPISASFSPGITSNDRPSSTFSGPKDFSSLSIWMIGSAMYRPF
jgi:hypothetical protein